MRKKNWSNPEVLNLNVENTEYGGNRPDRVDGPYVEVPVTLPGQDQPQIFKFWPMASS
jgi:hypothetical protein